MPQATPRLAFSLLVLFWLITPRATAQDELPPVKKQSGIDQSTTDRLTDLQDGVDGPETLRVRPNDSPLMIILKRRVNVAQAELDHYQKMLEIGADTTAEIMAAKQRLLQAKLDLNPVHPDHDAWREDALNAARARESAIRARYAQSDAQLGDVAKAMWDRLEQELRLHRSKTMPTPQAMSTLFESETETPESLEPVINGTDPDSPYAVKPDDSNIQRLKKQQINAAIALRDATGARVQSGQDDGSFLFAAQRKLIQLQLAFHEKPEEQLKVLEQALDMAKQFETNQFAKFEHGIGRPDDVYAATVYRIEVELQLEQQRGKTR